MGGRTLIIYMKRRGVSGYYLSEGRCLLNILDGQRIPRTGTRRRTNYREGKGPRRIWAVHIWKHPFRMVPHI